MKITTNYFNSRENYNSNKLNNNNVILMDYDYLTIKIVINYIYNSQYMIRKIVKRLGVFEIINIFNLLDYLQPKFDKKPFEIILKHYFGYKINPSNCIELYQNVINLKMQSIFKQKTTDFYLNWCKTGYYLLIKGN